MAAAPAKTHTTARTANTPNPMYMSRRLSPPSPVESTLNGTRRGPPLCGFREFDGLASTFDGRTICLGSRCPCQGLVLVVAGVNVVVVADCVGAVVSGTALVVVTGVVVVDATGEVVELGLTAAVVAGG